ncbi:E3 SUMO-protein ligase NSE2 isoform X4 [Bos mutus]|uniref:E3 SUMO-protein ligase NSE2 isoform X4 n=1 Tax=Bos mutus TaxID=72004 RepID=UPI0038B63AB1
MPGRSTSSSSSGSTGFISFSGVESALSSLKNFQSCISSGMDTASSVALDLVETQTEVSSEYSMDKAMVEFAMMDRELNHYLKAVQSTINHVKEERSEKIPDLKLLVEKKFLALQNKNSDADFQNNEKFVQFKQQLKELKKQSPARWRKASNLWWQVDSPVVQSCRASCHSALESCVINSTCSASVCTKLPSGDLPSQGDNALSG